MGQRKNTEQRKGRKEELKNWNKENFFSIFNFFTFEMNKQIEGMETYCLHKRKETNFDTHSVFLRKKYTKVKMSQLKKFEFPDWKFRGKAKFLAKETA